MKVLKQIKYKKKILSVLVLLSISGSLTAQVITSFSFRKTNTQKGGIVFLSSPSTKVGIYEIGQNENPSSGTGNDNKFIIDFANIDGNASIWKSSGDQFSLSKCSEIIWARLYRDGNCSASDENHHNLINPSKSVFIDHFASSIHQE